MKNKKQNPPVDYPSNGDCPIEKAFKNNPLKKYKVTFETCTEFVGEYFAETEEKAKFLFKKEYQGLPLGSEKKIKVKEIK